jgi:hypothetical protein
MRSRLAIVSLACLVTAHDVSAGGEGSIDDLYGRIAADLGQGRPLVTTVHVALCDNDSQGIVPVKNPKICDGEKPGSNLYWSTSGGLKAVLAKEGWSRVLTEERPDDDLAVRAAWRKRFKPGGRLRQLGVLEPFDVVVVGLAYRGARIREAMMDTLRAVGHDDVHTLVLEDGTQVRHGGASHLVGYIGHNYFLDVVDTTELLDAAQGDSTLEKGVFALSCLGDVTIRPAIQRPNTHVLVLNKGLTYPGAWTVHGIVRAVAAGKDGAGIHRSAAKAFASGKGKPLGAILKAFAYGG